MATVWTGSDLFIWGGDSPDGFSNDGALYDPTTMKWQKLPASPLSARAGAQAMWVDNEVIVISGYPLQRSSTLEMYTDLAAFNPTTNRWTTLAPMHLRIICESPRRSDVSCLSNMGTRACARESSGFDQDSLRA